MSDEWFDFLDRYEINLGLDVEGPAVRNALAQLLNKQPSAFQIELAREHIAVAQDTASSVGLRIESGTLRRGNVTVTLPKLRDLRTGRFVKIGTANIQDFLDNEVGF